MFLYVKPLKGYLCIAMKMGVQSTLTANKQEWMWVRFNEVDEPRACYREWSEPEREK